jgi:hypothetical protein
MGKLPTILCVVFPWLVNAAVIGSGSGVTTTRVEQHATYIGEIFGSDTLYITLVTVLTTVRLLCTRIINSLTIDNSNFFLTLNISH